MYYACDWRFRTDIDLNLIASTIENLECDIAILESHESESGNKILKLGIEIVSEANLDELIQNIGKLYGAEV